MSQEYNCVGAWFGKKPNDSLRSKTEIHHYEGNKLRTVGENVGYRIERTKITEQQYKQGINTLNKLDNNGMNPLQRLLNSAKHGGD